jgi:hypothetical protein
MVRMSGIRRFFKRPVLVGCRRRPGAQSGLSYSVKADVRQVGMGAAPLDERKSLKEIMSKWP